MSSKKSLPAEIRKACLILGVRQEGLTRERILETWKRQIVAVQPDKGGDHEAAIYLNTAKNVLITWIEGEQGHGWTPGSNPGTGGDPHQPAGVPRSPLPSAGSAEVALPVPELEDKIET